MHQLPRNFKECSSTGESLKAENSSPPTLSLLLQWINHQSRLFCQILQGWNHTSRHWCVEQALPSSSWHRYKLWVTFMRCRRGIADTFKRELPFQHTCPQLLKNYTPCMSLTIPPLIGQQLLQNCYDKNLLEASGIVLTRMEPLSQRKAKRWLRIANSSFFSACWYHIHPSWQHLILRLL